ncbi:hypothetical protein Anas_00322 [Armadillidium nasatum]|uniref:Uncharacterized protein n=1 Tax=Armadillidium nasatum TaxID=96803 RepID=A0A5N5TJW3_9CRUS|nr:hypothetical protein Anas_00322 [Armadillidium nasatum]
MLRFVLLFILCNIIASTEAVSCECEFAHCPVVDNTSYPGTCIEKKHHNLIDMLQGTQLTELSNSVHDRRLRLIRELENTIKK